VSLELAWIEISKADMEEEATMEEAIDAQLAGVSNILKLRDQTSVLARLRHV